MIEPLEPLHALLHPHDQTRLDILYMHCMRQDRAVNMLIEEHNAIVNNAVALGHIGAWILEKKNPNYEETTDE